MRTKKTTTTKKRPRYCKRHRSMPIITGHTEDGCAELSAPVSALITRYRFGAKRRKPHYVYYYEGGFYRARNAVIELDGDKPTAWEWALEPIAHADCWDAFAAQTVADGKAAPVNLTIDCGRVSRAVGFKGTPYAGTVLLDGSEGTDYTAALLDLDPPRPAGRHYKAA